MSFPLPGTRVVGKFAVARRAAGSLLLLTVSSVATATLPATETVTLGEVERIDITARRLPPEPTAKGSGGGGSGGFGFGGQPNTFGEVTRVSLNVPQMVPPAKLDGKLSDPASEENSEGSGCSASAPATTGAPVVIATGEKVYEQTDFQDLTNGLLTLRRTYRSAQSGSSLFGSSWFSSFDYPTLVIGPCLADPDLGSCYARTRITYRSPNGARLVYRWDGWSTGNDTYSVFGNAKAGRLSGSAASGWLFTDDEGSKYFGSDGRVRWVKSPGEVTLLTFSYVGGRLSSVTALGGRSVTFQYNAEGRVSAVTDPAGKIWRYFYHANGMLSIARSPSHPVNLYAERDETYYTYDSPYGGHLLTRVSINGTQYTQYGYFPDRRVSSSAILGSRRRDTFAYTTDSTTVTNEFGQAVSYTYRPSVKNAGSRLLVSISRSGTSTCPAAAASYTYDANEYIASSTDWNGNVTRTAYDEQGRLLERTLAFGTPAALRTAFAWDGAQLSTETRYDTNSIAFLVTRYGYVTSGAGKGNVNLVEAVD